jgi:spermidine synthase
MFHEKAFIELNRCLKGIFGKDRAHTLLFYMSTYPSGMWSLQLSTKGDKVPERDFSAEKARAFAKEKKLKYYNEGMHVAAFMLPGFVQKMLKEEQPADVFQRA